MQLRVGFGYDAHKFSKNKKRPLFLGGIEIKNRAGLVGHSDADVILHAVCNALLGAIGEKDIGYHFPPTDKKYKNIRSTILLEEVMKLVENNKYKINNLDVMVICAASTLKLLPYEEEMKKTIAAILKIKEEQISIKATTASGLIIKGGVAAYAISSVYKN